MTANTPCGKHAERYDESPVSIAVEKILTRADSEDSLGGARGGRERQRTGAATAHVSVLCQREQADEGSGGGADMANGHP